MQRSIFIDREDANLVEEEERNIFLRSCLEKIGVPLEDVWPDISLTVDQKVKLRDLLSKLEIEIITDNDRKYEIYYQDQKIAIWSKPRFILRKNESARTLNKQLFYEMIVNTWSVFEEENENEEDTIK